MTTNAKPPFYGVCVCFEYGLIRFAHLTKVVFQAHKK